MNREKVTLAPSLLNLHFGLRARHIQNSTIIHTWKIPPTSASPQVLACQDKISRKLSSIAAVTMIPWRLLGENVERTTHKNSELRVSGDERTFDLAARFVLMDA